MIPCLLWKQRALDSSLWERVRWREADRSWIRRPFDVIRWGTLLVGVVAAVSTQQWPLGFMYSLPALYVVLHVFLIHEAWNRYKQPVREILRGKSWDEFLVLPQPVASLLSPSVYWSARAVTTTCLGGLVPPFIWILRNADFVSSMGVSGLYYPFPCNIVVAVLIMDALFLCSMFGPFFYVEGVYWQGVFAKSASPYRNLVLLLEIVLMSGLPAFALVFAYPVVRAVGENAMSDLGRLLANVVYLPVAIVVGLWMARIWYGFLASRSESFFDGMEDQVREMPGRWHGGEHEGTRPKGATGG